MSRREMGVEEGSSSSLSRPSIGYPLGLALLMVMLLCMSGFFSCCYHWDKLRSLLLLHSSTAENRTSQSQQLTPHSLLPKTTLKEEKNQSESLTVLMPGDKFPNFVALPSPCLKQNLNNTSKTTTLPSFPV
ncbi:unnamed protein product [Camellia sinensis]